MDVFFKGGIKLCLHSKNSVLCLLGRELLEIMGRGVAKVLQALPLDQHPFLCQGTRKIYEKKVL